jgi:hypothetical protein
MFCFHGIFWLGGFTVQFDFRFTCPTGDAAAAGRVSDSLPEAFSLSSPWRHHFPLKQTAA